MTVEFVVLVFYVGVGLLLVLVFFVRGLAQLEFGPFEIEVCGGFWWG